MPGKTTVAAAVAALVFLSPQLFPLPLVHSCAVLHLPENEATVCRVLITATRARRRRSPTGGQVEHLLASPTLMSAEAEERCCAESDDVES